MADLLCDTNVLLRFGNGNDALHPLVVGAVRLLRSSGYRLVYAPQSLRELWNVATRPAFVNGWDYSIEDAEALARRIEATFTLLDDTPEMHLVWRNLVGRHEVKGV